MKEEMEKMLGRIRDRKTFIEEISLVDDIYNDIYLELERIENSLIKIIKLEVKLG